MRSRYAPFPPIAIGLVVLLLTAGCSSRRPPVPSSSEVAPPVAAVADQAQQPRVAPEGAPPEAARLPAENKDAPPAAALPRVKAPDGPAELSRLQGAWIVIRKEANGKLGPALPFGATAALVIHGERGVILSLVKSTNRKDYTAQPLGDFALEVGTAQAPRPLVIHVSLLEAEELATDTVQAVYRWEGDHLQVNLAVDKRPDNFETKPGDGRWFLELVRIDALPPQEREKIAPALQTDVAKWTDLIRAERERRAQLVAGARKDQADAIKQTTDKREAMAANKLRLALALADAGLVDKARVRVKEVIQDYPGTRAAREARDWLDKPAK